MFKIYSNKHSTASEEISSVVLFHKVTEDMVTIHWRRETSIKTLGFNCHEELLNDHF